MKIPHRLVAFVLFLVFSITTVTPCAHAENFRTWESLDTSRQTLKAVDPYIQVMEVGQACAASFDNHKGNDGAYLGLVGQMFILPEKEPTFDLAYEQRKKSLIQKINDFETPPTLLGELERDSTQIYVNQLVYNWKRQSKIFRGTAQIEVGDLSSLSEVANAVTTSNNIISTEKEIPNAIDSNTLQQHAEAFNNLIAGINGMCDDAHLIYANLMDAYNHSEKQDPGSNPALATILGPKETYAFIDGGIKGVIRKKIQELRDVTTMAAALYNGMISQTMFGKMYEADTQLQRNVGEFNVVSCVDYGKNLNLLPTNHDALWGIVGNSYGYLDWKYKDAIYKTLDTYGEEDSEDVLKGYVQTNPGSLELALIQASSQSKAMAVCKLIHDIKSSNQIKSAINTILAPVTMLASMMTAGAASIATATWVAYAALILNGYFFGTTIMDISLSYDLEERLKAAILADQINKQIGQSMIHQVQSSRPFSYVNLALTGLGSIAAIARLNQLSKMKFHREYIDATGGSTPKKYASAKAAFFNKQIKTNFFTQVSIKQIAAQLRTMKNPGNQILAWITGKSPAAKTKPGRPEPQGVEHNVADFGNYLNFIKNEKNAGSNFPTYGNDTFYKIPRPGSSNTGPIKAPDPVTGKIPSSYPSKTTTAPRNQTTTFVATKTKTVLPKNKLEIEPDIIETPVIPYVVPTPVLPDYVESPIASEKWEKIFTPKSDKTKRAENAIENNKEEFDLSVIEEIKLIATGLGDLAKKAKEWLSKHGSFSNIFNYTNNSSATQSTNIKEGDIASEFETPIYNTQGLNQLLTQRDQFLDQMIQNGMLTKELLVKGRHKERNIQFPNETDQLISDFNETNRRIQIMIEYINHVVSDIFKKHGFKTKVISHENFFPYLKVTITPETGLWKTLAVYTDRKNQKNPAEIYSFYFNPISLKSTGSLLSVDIANKEVNFSIPTAQRMIENRLSAAELHEIRHLFIQKLRDEKEYSLYHQTYKHSTGSITPDKSYEHFLSADEFFAYGNNLKIGAAKFRETNDPRWISFPNNAIAVISDAILKVSKDFSKNLESGTYTEIKTYDGPPKAVEIKLSSGIKLTKYFTTNAEQTLFSRYLDNDELYRDNILKSMYLEQVKLNHIAYQQKIWSDYLTFLLQDPVKNKDKIIEYALKMYRGTKESSPHFTTSITKLDDPYWPYEKDDPKREQDLYKPWVITESNNLLFNPFVATINVQGTVPSNPLAMSTQHGSTIALYVDGKKALNYNTLILDLKEGDILSLGNNIKFEVKSVFASYRDFFLIQLSDGRILRLPEKNITREKFLRFQTAQNIIKAAGIPVLETTKVATNGRYVLHEKVLDYFGLQNLIHYQVEKLSSTNRESWGKIRPSVDDSIITWASKTAAIAQIKNSSLNQFIYNYSQSQKEHQWKMVVTGSEIVEKRTQTNSAFMLEENMHLFVDGNGMEVRIRDAIKHEDLIQTTEKKENTDQTPPAHIAWLIKNLHMFGNYYDNLIEIPDRNIFLNKSYYLQIFEETLKSNQELISAFDDNMTHADLNKVIKQIVDEVETKYWTDIFTSHGNIDYQIKEAQSKQDIQDTFLGYSAMDIFSIPDFIYQARDLAFTYQTPYFRMKIVSDGVENFLLYNDEPRKDELDYLDATISSMASANLPIETKNTQHFKFRNDDVRYSSDLKFILIKALSDSSPTSSYFLFVKNDKNSYRPFGKIYEGNTNLVKLTDFDFILLEYMQTAIMHDVPDYGLLGSLNEKAKEEIKHFVRKNDEIKRFYINDPSLLYEFSTISRHHTQNINYSLLYGHRSNDFRTSKESCIVVINTKYYFPSLDPNHYFIYNQNGFEINETRIIDGMKYIFVTDASEKKLSEPTISPAPIFSLNTYNLAKIAAASPPVEQLKTDDPDIISASSPLLSMIEMIASEHFFNEMLSDIQRKAWDEIYKTMIATQGHESISENEAMIAVYRGKVKGIDYAKNEFYQLGFSFNEVEKIIKRLTAMDVSILRPSNTPSVYGNTDFLTQIPFHVEDINESRQNPIALFRGLSTFFENTNITQQELEKFTRWILDNFTFAPFWGKNQNGIDWGYSYLQMWAKSKMATSAISPQADLVFVIGEDNKGYVVVKIPRLKKEILYEFSDLVENLNTYIKQEDLVSGKPCPNGKYYFFTTHASNAETQKTTWQKEEYDEIPPSPTNTIN